MLGMNIWNAIQKVGSLARCHIGPNFTDGFFEKILFFIETFVLSMNYIG